MKAMYPGSFDPFHKGHLEIVKKASKLFSHLYIVVTKNINKSKAIDIESRVLEIENQVKDLSNVSVLINQNQLSVDFAKEHGVNYMVRGLRDPKDLVYEIELNDANKSLNEDIETIYFLSDIKNRTISSSKLKEIEYYKKSKEK